VVVCAVASWQQQFVLESTDSFLWLIQSQKSKIVFQEPQYRTGTHPSRSKIKFDFSFLKTDIFNKLQQKCNVQTTVLSTFKRSIRKMIEFRKVCNEYDVRMLVIKVSLAFHKSF
jgi:hypothetical protein